MISSRYLTGGALFLNVSDLNSNAKVKIRMSVSRNFIRLDNEGDNYRRGNSGEKSKN